MNNINDIEDIFFKYFGNSGSATKFNHNTYLTLPFDTIDNINIEKLYRENETDFISDEFLNSFKNDNANYDELMTNYMTISSHRFKFDSNTVYYLNISRLEVIYENLLSFIKNDIENEKILKIKESLETIRKHKDYLNKSYTFETKIYETCKILARNFHSLDEDELNFYKNKIKDIVNNNREFLGKNIDLNIVNFRINLDNILNSIKESVSNYIELKRTEDIESIYASHADRFIHYNKENSAVSKFLIDKIMENNIVKKLQFGKNCINKEVYTLSDNSLLIHDRKGEFKTIENSDQINRLKDELTRDNLETIFPNKPKLIGFIHNKYIEEGSDFYTYANSVSLINTIKQNEKIIKNMNINILLLNDKSLESIDDYLNKEIKKYKVNQFINKLLSNKYRSLVDNNSEKIMYELFNMNIGHKLLQDLIGKKIAAIQSTEQLNIVLDKILTQAKGFDYEIINDKLEQLNIEPILNENNILIFEVEDYNKCIEFGSPSWCIHRQKSYFDSYTANGNRQFIIYDFNKSEKDNDSIIGFTILPDGELKTQHLKNDDYIDFKDNKIINDLYKKTVFKVLEKDKMSPELKNEYTESIKSKEHSKKPLRII